jgi:hypothetical protein
VSFGSSWLRASFAGAALVAWGCSSSIPEPAARLSPPTSLCLEGSLRPCRETSEIESWLREPELTIVGVDTPGGGKQGAKVMTLRARDRAGEPVVFRAKFRPRGTESSINDPRRELGAYAVQALFLEPNEIVVPPTAGYCFAIDSYRKLADPQVRPTYANSRCLHGYLAYWLEDVELPEDAEDDDRIARADSPFDHTLFRKNALYRQSIADVSLLTYLVHHGDSHPKQFVIQRDESRPRVFSVDHSIAFSSYVNPGLKPDQDWSRLQVPALSSARIGRLKALKRQDLRALELIERYRLQDGLLVHDEISEPPGARVRRKKKQDDGYFWDGRKLEVGLTVEEIEGVWRRIERLLHGVEKGKVETF